METIVRLARIATVDVYTPLTIGTGGAAIGITLANETNIGARLVEKFPDVVPLALGGLAVALGVGSYLLTYRFYQDISQQCEQNGFTPHIMEYPVRRRLAKIYARESGRMEEFQRALQNCGL